MRGRKNVSVATSVDGIYAEKTRFVDRFPTDLELYRIMTTKLGEVSEGKKE